MLFCTNQNLNKEIYMLLYTLKSLLIVFSSFTFVADGDQLYSQFQTLSTSLSNQRGMLPGDELVIQKLRDELSAWNATHVDDRLIAAELQLSIWMRDEQQCNNLFTKLADARPDDPGIAVAWIQYLLSLDNAVADAIYADMVAKFPDSPEVVSMWAISLDGKNQFTKATTALESLDDDALATPSVAELYARLLFADNRFEESILALEAIDASLLVDDPPLSSRISRQKSDSQTALEKWNEELSIREVEEVAGDLPLVVILTSKGTIKLELYEDHAPNTVANFISLADTGYYDGIRFHRVLPKFMAQGGDPNSREGSAGNPGEGGPGYNIKDEHTKPDRRNHFAGSLSMAKTSAPNTGGSQFFLTHLPTPHLDGRHTVFGRITNGLDTARALEKNDEIISVMIIRKRDHEYVPEKIGEAKAEPVQPKSTPTLKPKLTPNSYTK